MNNKTWIAQEPSLFFLQLFQMGWVKNNRMVEASRLIGNHKRCVELLIQDNLGRHPNFCMPQTERRMEKKEHPSEVRALSNHDLTEWSIPYLAKIHSMVSFLQIKPVSFTDKVVMKRVSFATLKTSLQALNSFIFQNLLLQLFIFPSN